MALLVALTGLTGCRVATQVTVDSTGGGHGTVGVSVSLDASALAAIGGRSALAAQLQSADLVAAGWQVGGPVAGPGSTTVVTASHAYTSLAQAGQLVAGLAGPGSGAGAVRPFQLVLGSHHSFWRTSTSLTGQVDLRCGLACFGDSGLQSVTGSPIGVSPAPLEKASGQQPEHVFVFSVVAHLPGSVVRTDAASRQGSTLQWNPKLGSTLTLSATTQAWNWPRIIGAGAIALVVLLILAGWLARRWWTRRRSGRGRHRRGAAASGEAGESGEAVESASGA